MKCRIRNRTQHAIWKCLGVRTTMTCTESDINRAIVLSNV